MVVAIGRARNASCNQPGHVGGVDITAPGEIGVEHFFQFLNHHRLEFHVIGAKVVGKIEFSGRTWLYADRGAVELGRALHFSLFRDHESLAVVEINADKVEPEISITGERPRGIARENVYFSRLQSSKALLRG